MNHCTCKAGVTLNRQTTNATLDCEIQFCPLHASAPDLLAALTACLCTLIERGGVDAGTPCVRMARAAIRSAKSNKASSL